MNIVKNIQIIPYQCFGLEIKKNNHYYNFSQKDFTGEKEGLIWILVSASRSWIIYPG